MRASSIVLWLASDFHSVCPSLISLCNELFYKMSQTILPRCLDSEVACSSLGKDSLLRKTMMTRGLGACFPFSCTLPQSTPNSPVPSPTAQLLVFFLYHTVPFRTRASWFPYSFPIFPTSLHDFLLNSYSYFQCHCSFHNVSHLNTFSLLTKFSIITASFHSALCQCSSPTTKRISEIALTQGSQPLKV